MLIYQILNLKEAPGIYLEVKIETSLAFKVNNSLHKILFLWFPRHVLTFPLFIVLQYQIIQILWSLICYHYIPNFGFKSCQKLALQLYISDFGNKFDIRQIRVKSVTSRPQPQFVKLDYWDDEFGSGDWQRYIDMSGSDNIGNGYLI